MKRWTCAKRMVWEDFIHFLSGAQFISFLFSMPWFPYLDKIWSYLLRGCEGIVGAWQKFRRRRVACARSEKNILSYHQLPLLMPPSLFFLTSQYPDLIEIRSKMRKEREEEKKNCSSSLHGDLIQIPSDLCKRVRAAISFSRYRSRDLDPRMRSKIYKVLAHRWSRCSNQVALCWYQQRSGTCAATIRTRDIHRIRGMDI